MRPDLLTGERPHDVGPSPSFLWIQPDHSLRWILTVGAAASAAGALAALQPGVGLVLPLAVVAVLIARWPTAVVLVLVILCQEISPTSGFGLNATPLQVFGNDLYLEEIGKVPVLIPVLALAALAGLLHAHAHPSSPERVPTRACLLLGCCGLAVVAVSIYYGADVLTAVGQYGKHYAVALLALVVASTTDRQPGGWPLVVRCGAVALGGVLLTGTALLLAGAVTPESDGSLAVYYDSALPALAGAVLLVALLGSTGGRWRWVLVAVTGGIVLLSGRRNVWFALLVALAVVIAVRRGRARTALRVGLLISAFVGLALAVDPALATAMGDRVAAASSALTTGTGDKSTAGHVNDIQYGLGYALDSPWLGYGPNHGPLPGLAVQSGVLYVHNTYLLDWLKFGAVGLLVSTGLTVAMLVVGLRRLRGHDTLDIATVGAVFFVIAPTCALTAAFFTTTVRWPALLGLSAGATLALSRSHTATDRAGSSPRPT